MTNQKASLKYRLLDVAIALLALVALFYFSSSFIREANENGSCVNDLEEAETPYVEAAPSSSNEASEPTFEVGDVVEVYAPHVHPKYASFAKIHADVSEGGDNWYYVKLLVM